MGGLLKFRTIAGGRSNPPAEPVGDGTGFFIPLGTSPAAAARLADVQLIDGGHPVAVHLDFRLPRGPGLVRRDGSVRAAYLYVSTHGDDALRLADGVVEELTGIAWAKRSQVAITRAEKRYADGPGDEGVHVRICEVVDGH
jgi:hypothetical protein